MTETTQLSPGGEYLLQAFTVISLERDSQSPVSTNCPPGVGVGGDCDFCFSSSRSETDGM